MRASCAILAVLSLAACTTTPPEVDTKSDLGLLWVNHAAEYHAITRQVYAAATDDLPRFVADPSWSALPQQSNAAGLPPAVILDVDETVVSNIDFQMNLIPPFSNRKMEKWNNETRATPIQGVKDFVDEARRLGVTVFFVTNRPCQSKPGSGDPCPQKQTTIDDIAEVGIDTDAGHVLLSREQGWTREKLGRRLHIAKTHRVIALVGDDYGDFVECSRRTALTPCTINATRDSRLAALDTYDRYWGNGWYILPNPMHGSWTSVE